jgi:hypothetical protein
MHVSCGSFERGGPLILPVQPASPAAGRSLPFPVASTPIPHTRSVASGAAWGAGPSLTSGPSC